MGIINNLHILFALAIGGSWAKERAGGAFAAGIAFILINLITGHIYGVSLDMIADSKKCCSQCFRWQDACLTTLSMCLVNQRLTWVSL